MNLVRANVNRLTILAEAGIDRVLLLRMVRFLVRALTRFVLVSAASALNSRIGGAEHHDVDARVLAVSVRK